MCFVGEIPDRIHKKESHLELKIVLKISFFEKFLT
jgi:hypothetical protein